MVSMLLHLVSMMLGLWMLVAHNRITAAITAGERLVEAIQHHSEDALQPLAPAEPPDSFIGGPDSQSNSRHSGQTSPGGLEVSELPHSVYDDLVQGSLPDRDDAANHSGWRRR